MNATVRDLPIARNSASPVASNCRMAEPNWKPCVHSVHPALVYRPFIVKTGDPSAGFHVSSILRIFAAESWNRLWSLRSKLAGWRSKRIWSILEAVEAKSAIDVDDGTTRVIQQSIADGADRARDIFG